MTTTKTAIALSLLIPFLPLIVSCSNQEAESSIEQAAQTWKVAVGNVQQTKTYKDQFGDAQKARGKWVIITLTVKNTTGNGLAISDDYSPALSKLLNSEGQSFEVEDVDPLSKADLSKQFFPGETRSIQFFFDVPNSFKPHSLLVDGSEPLKLSLPTKT